MPTEFAQIELMLIVDSKNMYFLVAPYGSSYLPELGLYEVHSASGGMRCINGDPFHCYLCNSLSLQDVKGYPDHAAAIYKQQ